MEMIMTLAKMEKRLKCLKALGRRLHWDRIDRLYELSEFGHSRIYPKTEALISRCQRKIANLEHEILIAKGGIFTTAEMKAKGLQMTREGHTVRI